MVLILLYTTSHIRMGLTDLTGGVDTDLTAHLVPPLLGPWEVSLAILLMETPMRLSQLAMEVMATSIVIVSLLVLGEAASA